MKERRFDFGAWLTLAVSMGWFILIIGVTLVALYFPSDGWTYLQDNQTGTYRVDSPLTDAPSPLQMGDLIIAFNGQRYGRDDFPPLPSNLHVGQIIRYTIQRGHQDVDVDVTLVQVGQGGMVYNFVNRLKQSPRDFAVAILSFIVVAFAFFVRPHNLGARYLMLIFSYYLATQLFGFAGSALYVTTYPLPLAFGMSLAPTAWFWYFFPSLTLMALAFPVIKYPLRRFPRLLPALLYGVPFALLVVVYGHALATRDYSWANLTLLPVALSSLALTIISIFGALIHNWLTSREPIARAQLRWMTLGLGAGLGIPFLILLGVLLTNGTLSGLAADILWLMLLVPISLAIAITRYRLFDIDLIIRRTLQYSLLSGLLALVYFGSVVVLQRIFTALTGQGQNQLVAVVSTLAIAALFAPLRRRVQDAIDRRFYRKKYDAAKTLAAFAATCRDETDLDKLTASLIAVVQETMQPEHVSLWLKKSDK